MAQIRHDTMLAVGIRRANRGIKATKGKIIETSWSKLEYGDPEKPYTYAWIQQMIRKFLRSVSNKTYRKDANTPLTPFKAEFYIWPERQWKLAKENLLAQTVLQDGYPAYCAEELDKDYCEIEKEMNKHKFKA